MLPEPPEQPIVADEKGVIRFLKNSIVSYLLDEGPFDMNHLAMCDFHDADRVQFAQLIGYSVDGFCDLSYATDRAVEPSRGQEAYEIWGTDGHPHSVFLAAHRDQWLAIQVDSTDEDDEQGGIPECMLEFEAQSCDEAFSFFQAYAHGQPTWPAAYHLNKQSVYDLQRGYHRGMVARASE